jgi:hypothetical protein
MMALTKDSKDRKPAEPSPPVPWKLPLFRVPPLKFDNSTCIQKNSSKFYLWRRDIFAFQKQLNLKDTTLLHMFKQDHKSVSAKLHDSVAIVDNICQLLTFFFNLFSGIASHLEDLADVLWRTPPVATEPEGTIARCTTV